MADIFLSYAHEDQPAAKRIVDALAREGLEAWWDHEIPPGRSWDEVIGTRIGRAKVVIVIWSAKSVTSNFVKEEAQLAMDAAKLLPVKVADVEPPLGFRRLHAANLTNWYGERDHRQWSALLTEARERLSSSLTSPEHTTSSSYSIAGARWAITWKEFSRTEIWYFRADGLLEPSVLNDGDSLWTQSGATGEIRCRGGILRRRFLVAGDTLQGTGFMPDGSQFGSFTGDRR